MLVVNLQLTLVKGDIRMSIPISKKKILGAALKTQRGDKKLRNVAMECDISPASLSDIENGVLFPSESTFLRLVKILDFKDSKICDTYAKIKGTAPPDVIDYLVNNQTVIAELRQRMNKEKEEISS